MSIQRVDIKEGDQPSRFPSGSSMLLRYMLDDCATVDEAVRKTETGILVPEDWQNCHLMVSDETGRSVVIESRNSQVSVIPSDICTNFYLASDDMEDYYTVMPQSAALVILQSVVQNPYTNASGISMTQYSAIYNNDKKTVQVWPFQDYSQSFVFDVAGNRLPAD